ncbi:hypothetical protein ACFL3T_02100 [Patescibacteria group bacterium]
MADSKAKQDVLKKLQIASKYKKIKTVLAKETDKVGEFKVKQKDQKEIDEIKQKLNEKR